MGFSTFAVTFQHPLRTGPLNIANWKLRWLNQDYPILTASVQPGDAFRVTGTFGLNVPDPGPTGISYSPPPFDVVSDTARPTTADAFLDYPIHL